MRLPSLCLLFLVALGCAAKKERARAHLDLGTAYVREGNGAMAVGELRESVRLRPSDWRAWHGLALAYVYQSDLVQAEDAFNHGLKRAPDEAELLNSYGAFLVRQGRAAEGVEVFKKALLDLEYRNPTLVMSNLAYALYLNNQHDEARVYAREALRRQPSLCEAQFHLGLIEEARNDLGAAMDAYSRLVKACPEESLGARLRIGCLEVRRGNADLARPLLEEVSREAPATAFADEARSCLASAG